MNLPGFYLKRLKADLTQVSTPKKAEASRRYFPHGIHCIGATAMDIKLIIKAFHSDYPDLTPSEMLSITEYILSHAEYSEETLLAFGLINKFVKLNAKRQENYGDDLIVRFEYWLEHYANNWSLVDDLCIKTIYQFLMSRPHLIERTQHWAHSEVSWCRRASNVVWVKFIKRTMGKTTYYLNKDLVFNNCDLLLEDDDEFVQKSIGWLLKVTSIEYEAEVVTYIQNNYSKLTRSTLRYAIEKMDADTRKMLLAL
ncbi:MAG: DNA alkylation repair protein [Oleispira sp.]|nr:DNA alkylation repair protein [Oleispira sp.]MBL4879867.1 DNA alkylation repair protein [Oleispira sp.]